MPAKHYLGIDVGGTNTVYAIVNDLGQILQEHKLKTLPTRGEKVLLQEMQEMAQELLLLDSSIQGIGIGLPGIIDIRQGVAIDCPNLGWENVEVARTFSNEFGLPVYLENDVRCVALAEKKFGAARLTENAICLALGTGIGSGIFVRGELLRGAYGAAGEVGHMNIIPVGGETCGCGNSGCWETLASATAVVRQAARELEHARRVGLETSLKEPLDGRQIAEAARSGDQVAVSVMQEAGRFLGLGLVNLVNLFNPERIVIGGGLALAGDVLLRPAQTELLRRAMPYPATKVEVVRAELGDAAGVIGAAVLGM